VKAIDRRSTTVDVDEAALAAAQVALGTQGLSATVNTATVTCRHRGVDILIAAAAELANVPLVHYDRDYERIAAVTGQEHVWFVCDGALVENPSHVVLRDQSAI
jgi:predicted nucleic acid-binding protein